MVAVMMGAGCLGLLASLILNGRKSRVEHRVDALSGRGRVMSDRRAGPHGSVNSLPRVGTLIEPTNEEERSLLRIRLIQAGYYSPQSMAVFLTVKLLMMVAPAILGLVLGLLHVFPMRTSVLLGICLGMIGMVGPSFWLDHAKKKRHKVLTKSLPDALDLLVICLEGGLTLQSGINRLATELKTAHPELANELLIAQREVQMGLPESEAIHHMGTRTDLEEIRSLSSVISQAEQFGSSLVKAMRIHAGAMREQRKQRAEEMAQKAGTKILLPTLLFIFPAVFVVILGPAFFQVMRSMGAMMN
jgi:tight adherence protein C